MANKLFIWIIMLFVGIALLDDVNNFKCDNR
jgi:hypothetical protein